MPVTFSSEINGAQAVKFQLPHARLVHGACRCSRHPQADCGKIRSVTSIYRLSQGTYRCGYKLHAVRGQDAPSALPVWQVRCPRHQLSDGRESPLPRPHYERESMSVSEYAVTANIRPERPGTDVPSPCQDEEKDRDHVPTSACPVHDWTRLCERRERTVHPDYREDRQS